MADGADPGEAVALGGAAEPVPGVALFEAVDGSDVGAAVVGEADPDDAECCVEEQPARTAVTRRVTAAVLRLMSLVGVIRSTFMAGLPVGRMRYLGCPSLDAVALA